MGKDWDWERFCLQSGDFGRGSLGAENIKISLSRHGYRLLRLVGEGGFSQVYKIEAVKTGGCLACKVSACRELLSREAELLERLRHPLLPQFYEAWEEEERVFLVMEYASGNSLEKMLRRRGSLSVSRAVQIGIELAEGLSFLHQLPEPVIYRDLKPHHIQIREDGRVKLLDFGCACPISELGKTRAGTPGFSAPEQLSGIAPKLQCREGVERFGKAGDIYAFGRILQCMLGGKQEEGPDREAGRTLEEEERLCALAELCVRENWWERPADIRLCLYLLGKADRGYGNRKKGYKGQKLQGCLVERYVWKK